MNTRPEEERFRLLVDDLEAAYYFDDFTNCLEHLERQEGLVNAQIIVAVLRERLKARRAA